MSFPALNGNSDIHSYIPPGVSGVLVMFLQPPECLTQPRQPVKNHVRKNILHGLKR